MRLRSIEGQPGTLQVYVTSQVYFAHCFPNFKSVYVVNIFDNFQVQPKRCRKILIPIYALSLHVRQHEDDDTTQSSGPFNELKLNGNFTIAEVWFFTLLLLLLENSFFHILLRFYFPDACMAFSDINGCAWKASHSRGWSCFSIYLILHWNGPQMQI